jgi:C-terminal processing protease CtpA/Prc
VKDCGYEQSQPFFNHIRLIYKQLPRVKNRGVLGVHLAPAKDNSVGLKFTTVTPDGAAAKAGLQAGDVVLELNGKDIRETLFEEIDARGQAGESVHLKIQRIGVSEPLSFEVVRESVKDK